jgi:hypothetical protein
LDCYADDPVIKRALVTFRETIIGAAAQAAAAAKEIAPALKRLGVRSVVIRHSANVSNIAYSHAAKRGGIPVFIAGHIAATVPDSAIAQPSQDFLNIRLFGEAADFVIAQSPTVAAAARRTAPWAHRFPAKPFLWERLSMRESEARRPIVLWAGNFNGWPQHMPWVLETSDEMLCGLRKLAEAIVASSVLTLQIRIKATWQSKGEIGAVTLDRYLPKHERIIIRSDGSFRESLERATIVVTQSSTVYEEALLARIPVLLWGARARTHVLRGRSELPRENERSAVYTPPWDCDLTRFLETIVHVHHGRPLTDAELRELIWDESSAIGISELARVLASPSEKLTSTVGRPST